MPWYANYMIAFKAIITNAAVKYSWKFFYLFLLWGEMEICYILIYRGMTRGKIRRLFDQVIMFNCHWDDVNRLYHPDPSLELLAILAFSVWYTVTDKKSPEWDHCKLLTSASLCVVLSFRNFTLCQKQNCIKIMFIHLFLLFLFSKRKFKILSGHIRHQKEEESYLVPLSSVLALAVFATRQHIAPVLTRRVSLLHHSCFLSE